MELSASSVPYLIPCFPAKWPCFYGACLCLLWRAMAQPFQLHRDFSTQWTIFQSPFGGLGLLPSPPTCSPCCYFAGCLCSGAPGPVLRQTRLIEREGCSLLISSDSSVLPEVGVPPHAESFHSKITALSWKTQTVPRLPGQLAKGGRWILRTEERGETHFALRLQGGELRQHLVKI